MNYNIKHFDQDGATLKQNVTHLVASDVRFTEQINLGQGACNLSLVSSFDDAQYEYGDIFKIYEISTTNPGGVLVYTGAIRTIQRSYKTNSIKVTLTSLASLLAELLFEEPGGSALTFTLTQDPAETIRDVIDFFNANHPGTLLSYGANVVDLGSTREFDFASTSCIDAIDVCLQATDDYFFFIDASGDVYFKEKSATVTHIFNAGSDLVDLNIREEDVINKVTLVWSSGTTQGEDATSIATYGLKHVKIDDDKVASSDSATSYVTNYIAESKDPKIKITAIINSEYIDGSKILSSIHPGDICTITGLNTDYGNMCVNKISYRPDQVTVDFTGFDNVIDLVRG